MMGKYLPCLHQFYKELLAGERPSKDSQELAALLSPNVCMEDSNLPLETNEFIEPSSQAFHFHGSILTVDSHGMPHDSHSTTNGSQNDILLLQISLIQMMGSKLHSEILNQDVRESYMKATRVLLEDMDISSKLNLSIESWMNSCLYTLSEDSGSSKAAEWLQTITFVTKEILKGKSLNKTVTIQKLLIPLDSVFDGFYSVTFASYSGDCRTSGATTRPDTENIATTNQLPFIDLLEVFAAIRIQLKLNFSCLRILYLCASQILHCVISSAHYLVKKRLLLLLKQCILCQAGEDDADSCCAISQQDNHMHYDLLAVSNAVLQALVSGWLRQVPVSPKPSFFGGSEIFGVEDSNCGPDLVTLRAVSLILIKAMEIKVQNMTFADKEKGCLRAELQSWMSQLMTFLRMHFQCPERSQLLSHPCTLVSLVFGEQDDDMVEAARALLNIYKRSYRSLDSYSQGKTDISLETHEHCFNPHCIFLLMLQNLAFDHCVLLDFLISTETCFLEYLVRYLRLLQEDWHPFHCICVQFDAAAESFCSPAINDIRDDLNLTASVERDRTNNQTVIGGSKEAVVSCTAPHLAPKGELRNSENNSGLLVSSNRPWPLEQPQSLVDYESSEDSDSDGMEAPYLNIVSLKGSQGNEEMNNTETPGEIVNHVPEKIGSINVVSGPRDASSHSCEKHTKMSFEGMFKKSMRCLTELRKTISRLQGRSLFPYNATALLKLLLDIETRSRKDSSNPA
ncbi:protein Lines homolog 1 isoform X2 [Carcharodon carcharias]|uniref:protein Lines homolog 1 isoform X2 n=1 Tax=Carcharodon carcharias TaxID=13397 RepID=UPI001B7ED330|nr:protein Lines homolog 1 isoform X2 [Carcharodon carcharias]